MKELFKEIDKDKKGSIDERMLAAGIDKLLPAPPGPGAGPGPGPGPGAPPFGGRAAFSLGSMLAGQILRAADSDKDGKLTIEELTTALEKLFKEIDKDKKGSLDERQLAEGINRQMPQPNFGPPGGFGVVPFGVGQPLAEAALKQWDKNGDRKLSLEEAIAGVKEFFKETDKDKKGSIDEKMLAAGIDKLLPAPPGPGVGPGPGPGQGPGAGPGGFPGGPRPAFSLGSMLAGQILRAADSDKDGKLTVEELTTAMEKLFKEIDKDKKNALDDRQIAEGLNRLMAPPGFGAPGFGPPPGRPERP
jgi:Ca2+-binding EF-hand superfamily protein